MAAPVRATDHQKQRAPRSKALCHVAQSGFGVWQMLQKMRSRDQIKAARRQRLAVQIACDQIDPARSQPPLGCPQHGG
jgi:hypothetical protein